MAKRFTRQLLILAALQPDENTPVALTGANAILCSNINANPLESENVSRDLQRPFFGNFEELVGPKRKSVSFEVELVGSGTVGTAPAWWPLWLACGHTNVVDTAPPVDSILSSPLTASASGEQPCLTLLVNDSGVNHFFHAAKGTVELVLEAPQRPLLRFNFTGRYVDLTAGPAPVNISYAGFRVPQVVCDDFTGKIKLGATATFAGGVPGFTGGLEICSRGLTLNVNNTVVQTPMVGCEDIDITDRQPTCQVQLDQSAEQEVARMADVVANASTSITLVHDSRAGFKVGIHLPRVQFTQPTLVDINGRRLQGYTGRVLPVQGNDDYTLFLV